MIPPSDRDIVIREAGLRDALRLRSADVTYRLSLPESTLEVKGPLAAASGLLTAKRDPKATRLVGEFRGELVGFAEFRSTAPDYRWQLWSLGLTSGTDDPLPVWPRLLDEGTRLAGSQGVKRLYARAPVDSAAAHALRSAGYSPYAREIVYLSTAPVAAGGGIRVRQQERTDTWAVHQLYNSSVPREVLYAEAYTSHRWELPTGRLAGGNSVKAWLHEVNHTPLVYARCESARRRHVIDLIYAPGAVTEAADLIDELILRSQPDLARSEVYLAVRSYNAELEQFLLERTFRPWLEQELFSRYTTAPIRVKTAETVLSESEALERAKQRVPVYFQNPSEHAGRDHILRNV